MEHNLDKFQNVLLNRDIQDKLNALKTHKLENRQDIDQTVKSIEEVLRYAAEQTLLKKKFGTTKNRNKRWYDNSLRHLKQVVIRHARMLQTIPFDKNIYTT